MNGKPEATVSEQPSFVMRARKYLWRRKNQQKLLMFVLMFLFGFILMEHVQTVRAGANPDDLVERYVKRQAELAEYQDRYAKLLAENETLTLQKEKAITDLLNREGYEGLLSELKKINVLAGFTEVRGPGVTVVLDDKPGYDILTDSLDSIVHDGDILSAINLLIDSGAAAIAVNGLRITNSTYILCNASTILCNQQRITPPFIITARGDPASMAEAIRTDQNFSIRQASGIDLVVKVTEETEVVIPAFAEADNISQYIDRLEVVAQ